MAHEYCTSYVLLTVARPGFWEYLGLSRNVNITYFNPAKGGDVLLMECEVSQRRRRMGAI